MSSAPKFKLITELMPLIRRDFPLANEALLNPYDSNPLLDGEWLELDPTTYKLKRGGTAHATNPEVGTFANIFPVHTERGRYDTQAVLRTNVIFLGMYEAETEVCDTTGITTGDPLQVANVTVLGARKRGLVRVDLTSPAAANTVVVGYVSKILTGSNKVRFIHYGNEKKF